MPWRETNPFRAIENNHSEAGKYLNVISQFEYIDTHHLKVILAVLNSAKNVNTYYILAVDWMLNIAYER